MNGEQCNTMSGKEEQQDIFTTEEWINLLKKQAEETKESHRRKNDLCMWVLQEKGIKVKTFHTRTIL